MTIYFLKDLISGKKKRVLGKDVRHIAIPQYEGLSINDIAAFVNQYGSVGDYLPDGGEIKKVPKQWIANICHSVLKNVFAEWVKNQVEKRNKELVKQKGLLIDMDPDMAAAFQASTK